MNANNAYIAYMKSLTVNDMRQAVIDLLTATIISQADKRFALGYLEGRNTVDLTDAQEFDYNELIDSLR